MTIWKTIPNFPNYEISDDGRVRSVWRGSKTGKRTQLATPIERSLILHPRGYVHLALYERGVRSLEFVHILMAQVFIENPEGKPTVNHIDGAKTRNVISNLEWATHSEQHIHRVHRLNIGRGSRSCGGKLTEDQVRSIKIDPRTHKVIATDYGVGRQAISDIKSGRTWRHVTAGQESSPETQP